MYLDISVWINIQIVFSISSSFNGIQLIIYMQGTAGVAIAGLLGAVRAQGKPMIDFPKQKIVVAGAGRFVLVLFCTKNGYSCWNFSFAIINVIYSIVKGF